MGAKHFDKLDDEGRALSESWQQMARVVGITGALAALVWAACALLRQAVHVSSERVLEHAEARDFTGGAYLLSALLLGGVARALLYRSPTWRKAHGDGMDQALANYQVTYDDDRDDPGPRYERPDFAAAGRKAAATWLTVGSGASGGLEAPLVSISESLAAGVARVLRVKSEHELRTYQLAAIAAAVSTLLGAPFTAALFASEVAYGGSRIVYRKLAYALWAGVVAYWLNTWLRGAYVPLFSGPRHAARAGVHAAGARRRRARRRRRLDAPRARLWPNDAGAGLARRPGAARVAWAGDLARRGRRRAGAVLGHRAASGSRARRR